LKTKVPSNFSADEINEISLTELKNPFEDEITLKADVSVWTLTEI
jgi:hypothetical protein